MHDSGTVEESCLLLLVDMLVHCCHSSEAMLTWSCCLSLCSSDKPDADVNTLSVVMPGRDVDDDYEANQHAGSTTKIRRYVIIAFSRHVTSILRLLSRWAYIGWPLRPSQFNTNSIHTGRRFDAIVKSIDCCGWCALCTYRDDYTAACHGLVISCKAVWVWCYVSCHFSFSSSVQVATKCCLWWCV